MSREYNQIEIENLARVRSQNAQGSGHYTPTPPLGASNGMKHNNHKYQLIALSQTRHLWLRDGGRA